MEEIERMRKEISDSIDAQGGWGKEKANPFAGMLAEYWGLGKITNNEDVRDKNLMKKWGGTKGRAKAQESKQKERKKTDERSQDSAQ